MSYISSGHYQHYNTMLGVLIIVWYGIETLFSYQPTVNKLIDIRQIKGCTYCLSWQMNSEIKWWKCLGKINSTTIFRRFFENVYVLFKKRSKFLGTHFTFLCYLWGFKHTKTRHKKTIKSTYSQNLVLYEELSSNEYA